MLKNLVSLYAYEIILFLVIEIVFTVLWVQISMPKMLIDVTLGDQQQRNLSMLLLRDFVMFVRRGTNVVASWRMREWNWISQ
ncbi:hypothetical protein HanOQP8_Chr04g0135271 [Helianthus annuus]|nr:hypothetical protein HanOQP8_Chr04g0135271 [Helianthus annuus]